MKRIAVVVLLVAVCGVSVLAQTQSMAPRQFAYPVFPDSIGRDAYSEVTFQNWYCETQTFLVTANTTSADTSSASLWGSTDGSSWTYIDSTAVNGTAAAGTVLYRKYMQLAANGDTVLAVMRAPSHYALFKIRVFNREDSTQSGSHKLTNARLSVGCN